MVADAALIRETSVWSFFLMNVFFALKGSKLLVWPTLFLLNVSVALKGTHNNIYFLFLLAHLSRRLMGELIVYRSSRRPSVRPSTLVRVVIPCEFGVVEILQNQIWPLTGQTFSIDFLNCSELSTSNSLGLVSCYVKRDRPSKLQLDP